MTRLSMMNICCKCHGRGHYPRECTYNPEELPRIHKCALSDVIIRTTRITFQISACVFFMMVYQLLKAERLSSVHVLEGCWSTAVLGQVIYQASKNLRVLTKYGLINATKHFVSKEEFRVTVFYLFASFLLAPVLRTLTQTISTDTIHAMSIGLLFAHLLTNDYGIPGFLVSKTISINAAIIAAICLSSRLATNQHSIALITLAIESFVLFPIFASIIWDSSFWLITIVGIVSYTCLLNSLQLCTVYIGSIAFVTLIFPLSFIISQKFKYKMYGPWDEAVVAYKN